MIVSLFAIGLSIAAVIIGILLFKRKSKERKIVILGERNTGKTRLFVYLSRKEKKDAHTIPTIETRTERISPTLVLIDTPGGTANSIQKSAEDLSAQDLILFLYNKKKSTPPKNLQARMVCIYTGEGNDEKADYSIPLKEKELPCDQLKRLSSSLF